MPVPQGESRSVTKMGLGYMRPFHREVARRLICGQKLKQIATDLGANIGRLSVVVRSPLFQVYLARLEEERTNSAIDVRKSLEELAPVALENLERTMYKTTSDTLRTNIAKDILDRAGFGAEKKLSVTGSISTPYHSMQDAELKRLLMERIERVRVEGEQKAAAEANAPEITYDAEEVEWTEAEVEGIDDSVESNECLDPKHNEIDEATQVAREMFDDN